MVSRRLVAKIVLALLVFQFLSTILGSKMVKDYTLLNPAL